MVKIYLLLLIFSSYCSAVPDPKQSFLSSIRGQWKTTSTATTWFNTLTPTSVAVPENTVVNVDNSGNFTINGIPFSFIAVENKGIIAIYSVIHPAGSAERFIGFGFNNNDDVLFTAALANSANQVSTPSQGSVFMKK